MSNHIKFLVCVSHSDHARVALKFACARAEQTGANLELLHVLPPADFQSFHAVADKIQEERRQEAETWLQAMAEEVQQLTGRTPSIIFREGDVEEQIIQVASEDSNASLLIVGASPESSGRREIISSLVTGIGDKLLIPLLVVPGNLTDQQIEELK